MPLSPMPVKILLVDDDKEFREELKSYLEEYDCIEASSGEEAIAVLKRPHEIDLAILDVMMPGSHGTEVLREMKRLDPGLGIIILTGFGSKDVAIEALKGHADDYVEKGADICKIREIIERLTETRRSCAGAAVREVTRIERVKRFLEKNCYKKTTLVDAAQAVSLSPKYLSRAFAQETGVGFARYRQEVKVREGRRLLKAGGLNVDEIAERLGYKNAESFIRVFKKLAGCTPSDFRRKQEKPARQSKGKR